MHVARNVRVSGNRSGALDTTCGRVLFFDGKVRAGTLWHARLNGGRLARESASNTLSAFSAKITGSLHGLLRREGCSRGRVFVKGVTFRSDVVVVVVRKGMWQIRSLEFPPGLWKLVSLDQAARPWNNGLPCMQCETQCLASRICMLLFSGDKTTTQPDADPWRSLCIMICMYVPESSQKEGYIRGNMQNPSGWYHGDCLTKRDWEEDNKFRKEPVESRLTAGCGVSSTVARSTWQNARPERRCFDVPCTSTLGLLIGARLGCDW